MSLKEKFNTFIETKLLPYIFKISDQPMLFQELLHANKVYQEGMSLEGTIQGYRMRIGRAYLVYLILWHFIIGVPAAVFHTFLATIDCHLLILVAVLFTGFFFAIFSIFSEWLHEKMALQMIKKAWKNHFPHFKYELHAKEVATIFSQANQEEVHHKDMRLYIFNNIVESK
ncbi:MAG: hypothetical protein U9N52_14165 [Campylobacterota bacterium]|nr:hypothetical protein [Campylobacterota bacterium]